MRIYDAECAAELSCPAPALSGTLADAQSYVDSIVRSRWWKTVCPRWCGRPTPRAVQVVAARGAGSCYVAATVDGVLLPQLRMGTEDVRPYLTAIASPWSILHELSHVATASSQAHGREFAATYLVAVRRWLGTEAANALSEGYRANNVAYRARRNAA